MGLYNDPLLKDKSGSSHPLYLSEEVNYKLICYLIILCEFVFIPAIMNVQISLLTLLFECYYSSYMLT